MRIALLVALTFCASTTLAQPWVDARKAQTLLNEEKFAESAAAYKALAESNPYDGSNWSQYGYSLHANKQWDEALKCYAKAIDLGFGIPNNTYNTACAHALLGHKDEALKWLEKALAARFSEQQTLENDSDMDPLRDDPRFAALTGIIKGLKTPPTATREDGWAWDLDFFARRMKQMHWDLYVKVPESAFKAELDKLKADIKTNKLTDTQARLRLRKITALVGDGHTASRLTAEGEQRKALPIHMFAFKDGLYIMGTDAANESLIGAKVLKFGMLESVKAMDAVKPYLCVDNDMGYLAAGPTILANTAVLEAIGAAQDESAAELTVQVNGGTSTKTVRLEPIALPDSRGLLIPSFTYLHQSSKTPQPLYLEELDKPLRMKHVPEHKLVYFFFGAVTNTPGLSLRQISDQVFDFIDKNDVEHLVIDMRFNGGGNTGLVRPLINRLIACDKVNQEGHLWVIIGRHTFSAAQNTVNLIDKQCNAIFVGEPTGSAPMFIGESTFFILPHSKTRVSCSSRYWQYMDSTDQRTWVHPRIPAEMTFADYAAGKDAAMEAILKWAK